VKNDYSIKGLFGIAPLADFAKKVKEGSLILDVRSPAEFENNHIKGAVNIPQNTLSKKLNKLKKYKFISCYESVIGSASAKSILKANGFESVYNGRGWHSLNQKIQD
jgi:rhodanese-related sulfurtransferase